MLSGRDLKEYRILSNLSQRDVARYCDVSHDLIGKVERGDLNITEYNHAEITRGINRARQAIADGTFEEDKLTYKEKAVESESENPKTRTRKTTKK